jgi:hypothetical protein
MAAARPTGGYLERPRPSGLADVIDVILDKGLCFILYLPSFRSERAIRSGRADRTVTRHLSRAGSYQVTLRRPDRPDGRSAAASPKPTGPHERHREGQFMRRSDSGPAA